jgi:membrane protein implicated in regulation of membrane protease activity
MEGRRVVQGAAGMDDPEVWRWIWLITAVVAGAGEMLTTGFFLLPFAVGALAAALLAFLGVAVAWQLVAFAVVTVVVFLALRPIAHRLDRSVPDVQGVGAKRLVGVGALVLEDIPAGQFGMIRVGSEEWRAESVDGQPIPAGTTVTVRDVQGTRARVEPAN